MNLKWAFILSAATYFLQGIEGLPGLAIQLWMKETLYLPDYTVQQLMSWTILAWMIKPIWGYLTDSFLTKKTWVNLSVIGGIIICILLGSLSSLSLIMLIILVASLNWSMSLRDVAVDGIACVEGKATETTGKFQAVQWGSVTFAALLAILGGGLIAQHSNYHIGYLLLIPFLLSMFYILYKFKEPLVQKNKDSFVNNLLSYKELFLNKDFVLVCIFLYLYKTAPAFGTPLLYIKRDIFHWSAMQIAYLDAIVLALELIGAWFYAKYCKVIPIKKTLIFSILIGVPITLCYLYYTPITAYLYGALFGTIGMIIHLVCMDFMARKSLAGKEATSFAMLCSISNFAGWSSAQLGGILLPIFGLQYVIIISSFMGLMALPIIKYIKWR